ncbi:right-handed parallel beta-helix repeat-containing protein [Nitrosospira briensis]|uniref:right-handed parallel beta-helix repeat-containing protein n=1 Tax=Nitrosospira briensis TaxID=35799 RepID=UPI0008E2E577|nr:right-handed parallel beta-helix repeat-containing protein [Nitrosospira briensis]SFN73536.1 parallel beta-helix repeat (two copies) [Nitrosospira briensis]
MTTWYVRPDTSHSEIRDGTSHATAWGGWSSIVWGAAGVTAGDTLYICGAHSIASTVSIGNHGATASRRVTISGDYAPDPGSMTVSVTGAVFLTVTRSHTTLDGLTITANTSNGLYLYATTSLVGLTIQRCTFHGGIGAAIVGLSAANGQSYADLTISNNRFIGGSGAPLGGAISWTVAASGLPVSTLSRVTIHGNSFTGCAAGRAVVQLRLEDGANLSSKMADIVITDNIFRDCATLGMEIVGPSLTGNPSYYGINTGIRITGNKFYDMTNTNAAFNLGGAMGIGGFGPSLSEDFGSNVIARNEAYRLIGPSGFLNLFYGTYRIFDNYAEDIVASQADGNGLLFDHGCDNTVAYGNYFRRVIGNEATENSGCGIMILDAANITAYGNIFDGCKVGVFIGNKKDTPQSSNLYNNTFLNCSFAGVYALSTANKLGHLVRNNIFTAARPVPSAQVAGGGWTGESNNAFHRFGSGVGHAVQAPHLGVDPELDSDYRPHSAVHKRTGTYLGGKDHYGKHFYDPPNIGGVDDVSATPRYLLMKP